MTIQAGTKLGPYEILAPAGAGGMGEVYRAKDTRLERTVAIKILPAHLSPDPDLRQRFEREAKAVSSLNHPHICTLHDIGHQDGTDYLVMEFIEGETLSSRLQKGPITTELLLQYSIQIADALDKAHREGIVHRDLKPGNIMITKSGVKLLDFGLAKLQTETQAPVDVSSLQTEQKELTKEGTILGTLQYMSPEQLEGKATDTRSDIFAFGTVIYEMATGKKAFEGQSQASLIAAILEKDPVSMSALQPMTPPALERLVRACLAKDPEDCLQNAHDVKTELRWIMEGTSQPLALPAAPRRARFLHSLLWPVVALLVGAAVTYALLDRPQPTGEKKEVIQFSIDSPDPSGFSGSIALSPDGRQLAFVSSGDASLFLRSLDSLKARRLPGTQGASYPFWAPDSRSIGFFSEGKLKKIALPDGTPDVVCDVQDTRGGAWGSRDVLLFIPSSSDALYKIPAAGGTASPATTLDSSQGEIAHRWPSFLPDGNHFLYWVQSGQPKHQGIKIGSLDSKDTKFLVHSKFLANFGSPGYLLFLKEYTLVAQLFDLKTLEVSGEPASLGQDVWTDRFLWGLTGFSVSHQGVLAYRRTTERPYFRWFDRTGKEVGMISSPKSSDEPAFSPDQKRLVVGEQDDLWIIEVSSGNSSRFTFDPSADDTALWSPDGNTIYFSSNRNGAFDIFEKPANGTSEEKLLLKSADTKWVDDVSRDGRFLIYDVSDPKTRYDLWLLPLFGDRKPEPFLKTEFNETHAQFSPDMRWIAYASDESSRPEIYVRSFPAAGGGKWQISTAGGDTPQWSRDGKELFYIARDRTLMAVDIKSDSSQLAPGAPKALFRAAVQQTTITGSRNDYAVSADGRFLMNAVSADTPPASITVVLNWPALLKK